MSRIVSVSALAALFTFPLFAANPPCNLGASLNCANGMCTGTTTNAGANVCSGEFVIGIFVNAAIGQATVGNFNTTLALSGPQCFDSTTLPQVGLPFAACVGLGSLGPGSSFTMTANVTPGQNAPSPLPVAAITAVLDPMTSDELAEAFAVSSLSAPTCKPIAFVVPVTQTGVPYSVSWSGLSDPSAMTFVVLQSLTPDMANPVSRTVTGLSTQITQMVNQTTRFYYRVSANSCSGSPGPPSDVVSIAVQALPPATGRSADAVVPVGSTTPVTIPVKIDAPAGGKTALDVTFTATTDKSYLSVSPPSGTIPSGGSTIVNVTANPTNLPPGANTGTLTVTSSTSTIATKSVSVSLVTPVAPGSKTLPPSNALIIPAVAHAPGALGPFQSDVRLTNTSTSSVTYQVTFTPTRTDATKSSKTTTVNVDGGQTIALNDILKDFFGVGATDVPGDAGQGTLEIRPLNTGSTLNYASSRTFTFNPRGTFGQFIAAIPFTQFATKASLVPVPGTPPPTTNPVLSMQQVANSTKFRTNLGFVEGSGAPASGTIRFLDGRGGLIKAIPYSLQPGEHQQASLASYSLPAFDDGRIEVTVESATGAVTAYASVLDNITNDPLEVTPVQVSQIKASRYILPGMAALGGTNNFHSDIRLYNGGTTPVQVNATFYPQVGSADMTPVTAAPFSIDPGTVLGFDDAVAILFNKNGFGGSIVFTTAGNTSLVATGRTYTIDSSGGTFGQFIPGVSPSQGIAAGDRPLQILQLEQSNVFRSNLGLAELTGNPAHVRITAYVPDSKVGVATELDLGPNQFLQLGRVLLSFNLGSNVYNARISVEVTSGSGRVTAYGSVIDNLSLDPTYVPAQGGGS